MTLDDLVMALSQNPVVLLTHIPSSVNISLIMIKCYTDNILASVLLKIFGAVGELHDRLFGAERVKLHIAIICDHMQFENVGKNCKFREFSS